VKFGIGTKMAVVVAAAMSKTAFFAADVMPRSWKRRLVAKHFFENVISAVLVGSKLT
jgi:hypothetical protein